MMSEGIIRCTWPGISDPEYTRYHDQEWGVPTDDDRRLFEKLALEGFQAGLSWLTILRKRENFRRAFAEFDPMSVSAFTKRDINRLMKDAGIVRNRAKIEATIANARAYLHLSERQSLSSFFWQFLDGKPIINRHETLACVPAKTELSTAISKALKAQGFRFVGPTTVYSFLQATGMINDHLISCHRHRACATLQHKFRVPNR